MKKSARGSRVRIFLVSFVCPFSASVVASMFTTNLTPYSPTPSPTTEKLEKEKTRAKELEQANKEQQVEIEKLSEEYQDAMDQLDELQQQIDIANDQQRTTNEEWEEEKAALLHEHATRIQELQDTINELLNSQSGQEEEYNRVTDDLEQLNKENAEYLEKIEGYERMIEEIKTRENEYEESRVKFR